MDGQGFAILWNTHQIHPKTDDTFQPPQLKTGTVSNFDLRVMTKPEHVGICFTGFLDVPRDGLYTFYTTSDDGSRLFVGRPSLQLKAVGRTTFPKPQSLVVGQTLLRGADSQWAEVEGKEPENQLQANRQQVLHSPPALQPDSTTPGAPIGAGYRRRRPHPHVQSLEPGRQPALRPVCSKHMGDSFSQGHGLHLGACLGNIPVR